MCNEVICIKASRDNRGFSKKPPTTIREYEPRKIRILSFLKNPSQAYNRQDQGHT